MSYRDDLSAARAKIEVLEEQLRDLRDGRAPVVMGVVEMPAPPGAEDGVDEALAAVDEAMDTLPPPPALATDDAPSLALLEVPDVGRCASCAHELVTGAPIRVPVLGTFAYFVVCPQCQRVEHRFL